MEYLAKRRAYEACGAVCGYISSASAVLIANWFAEHAPRGLCSKEDAQKLEAFLRNEQQLVAATRHVMEFIRDCRRGWIESHPQDFNAMSARQYMTAEVANYEISDYLIAQSAKMLVSPGVHFLRYNQWPERRDASHEELIRLQEEEKFGGCCGDKAIQRDQQSLFVIEPFSPDRQLLTPDEWLKHAPGRPPAPLVYILDLNGHFCVATPGYVDDVRTLFVFNTTDGSYLGGAGGRIAALGFDLAFAPEVALLWGPGAAID